MPVGRRTKVRFARQRCSTQDAAGPAGGDNGADLVMDSLDLAPVGEQRNGVQGERRLQLPRHECEAVARPVVTELQGPAAHLELSDELCADLRPGGVQPGRRWNALE